MITSNKTRNILNQFAKRFGMAQCSKSYIRADVNLQSVTGSIAFNILTNQGTPNTSEYRLQLQDAFVVTAIGFYVIKAGSSTSASNDDISRAQMHTFPNDKVFTGTNEATNLQGIYNGFCSITVNQNKYFPAIPMRDFYRVSTSQQGVAVSAVASTGVLDYSEWNGPDYGMISLDPTIVFNGSGSNEIVVTPSNSLTLAGTSSTNLISFWAKGIRLANMSGKVTAAMIAELQGK